MIPKYYEFMNKVKIMSGYRALENIPHELKGRGSGRPMIITDFDYIEEGALKRFISAFSGSELVVGSIFKCSKALLPQCVEQAISEFKACFCDGILALGGSSAFQTGKAVSSSIPHSGGDDILLMGTDSVKKSLSVPFIVVPVGSSGVEITGVPDVIVLDPRMTLNPSLRDTALSALDTLCHAIEAYTCLQKNPLSDAYAISAINLVRENLPKAIKYRKDRKAHHALANAAVLSGIAFLNSKAGIAHALAYGLEGFCKISHEEAVGIVLAHCMDNNMLKLDEYYGELLLPLAGPEIYADTQHHQRGRKTAQTIRNIVSDYHQKCGIPICLSEMDVKRADFDGITALCLKSTALLYNPTEVVEEDIRNILNLAF